MMRLLIIDNQTDDLERVKWFCRRRGYNYDVRTPSRAILESIDNYDLVILSGGLWYEDPTQQGRHYFNELELINKSTVPIIGICLGVQLIASAYGGELMRLKKEYHGRKHIQLSKEGESLLRWPSEITVYENHTVGVVSCPPQFQTLAYSDECLEIIKHNSRPIVGVQFHPERTDQANADLIWDSLIKLIIP